MRLLNRFTYHPPQKGQTDKYRKVRNCGYDFAKALVDVCPDSSELRRAVDRVEEAVMLANAAIARHPEGQTLREKMDPMEYRERVIGENVPFVMHSTEDLTEKPRSELSKLLSTFADQIPKNWSEQIDSTLAGEMAKHGIVALFGMDDTGISFEGAFSEEVFCNELSWHKVCKDGLWGGQADVIVGEIQAKFDADAKPEDPMWTFQTDIPHESFFMTDMDGTRMYCRGIVFSLDHLTMPDSK